MIEFRKKIGTIGQTGKKRTVMPASFFSRQMALHVFVLI
jgi:hypothetical protein